MALNDLSLGERVTVSKRGDTYLAFVTRVHAEERKVDLVVLPFNRPVYTLRALDMDSIKSLEK